MSKENEEAASDWLIVVGAVLLFSSLFLTWSHQVSPHLLILFGHTATLSGVPRDPTAWQVYSTSDVVLTLVAAALGAAALFGSHRARLLVALVALLALAFVVHALAVPPTNGVLLSLGHGYLQTGASAGPGETLALVGLLVALGGLGLSFVSDRAPTAAVA